MPLKRKLEATSSPLGSIPTSASQSRNKNVHPFFSQNSSTSTSSNSSSNTATIGKFLTSPSTLVHYQHLDLSPPGNVAIPVVFYDLDGTLIKTSSGARFPKSRSDWTWWHPSVPSRLKAEVEQGRHIVILSNQGDSRAKVQTEWRAKLPLIAAKLPNVPFRVLAALSRSDVYRKPNTGMLDYLKEHYASLGWKIDMECSVFVGDAAGRAASSGKQKDHGNTDLKMAINARLKFLTPEEHFLGQKRPDYPDPPVGFKPSLSLKGHENGTSVIPSNSPISSSTKEIIIFVGPPASGKSTFYKKHFFPKYEHINQDTLGNRDKCLKVAAKLLKEGKSIVIDNTNRDKVTRAYWVRLANEQDVSIRLFYFQCSLELAKHNNQYRALYDKGSGRSLLPDLAFESYKSQLQEPSIDEGFDEIRRVDFVWEGSATELEVWDRYLT